MQRFKNFVHSLQSSPLSLDYLVVRGRADAFLRSSIPEQMNQVNDWAEIVEQHGPDVWRTAYRLLSDRDDASDCYQEAFLQAVKFSRRQTVTCWPAVLRRMATARAIDLLRRRYRSDQRCESLSLQIDEPIGSGRAPDANAQLRESLEQLRRALAEVPPAQAEAFWLSEVEMLSHTDIGGQLGVGPKQVAVLLHRGKQKLRQLLAARGVTHEALR